MSLELATWVCFHVDIICNFFNFTLEKPTIFYRKILRDSFLWPRWCKPTLTPITRVWESVVAVWSKMMRTSNFASSSQIHDMQISLWKFFWLEYRPIKTFNSWTHVDTKARKSALETIRNAVRLSKLWPNKSQGVNFIYPTLLKQEIKLLTPFSEWKLKGAAGFYSEGQD